MVKPNVAMGRDHVPGRIVLLLHEATKVLLDNAVVDRPAGREDTHVKDWAEFDVCLVPKRGDISYFSRSPWPSTLFKLHELCMW